MASPGADFVCLEPEPPISGTPRGASPLASSGLEPPPATPRARGVQAVDLFSRGFTPPTSSVHSALSSWVFAVQLKAWVPTLLWCCCCARTFSPICSLEAATPSQLQHSVCQAQQPGSNFPTSRRRLL